MVSIMGVLILYSKQSIEVLLSLYSCQHLLFFVFYNSHSNWGEIVSHCGFDLISLVINDVEHFFIYLFICMSFFEKYLFRSLLNFLIAFFLFLLFFFLLLSYLSSFT